MTPRLTEARQAVQSGSYCVAFTADRWLCDHQLHAVGDTAALDRVVAEAEEAGRVFLGVAVLTADGPRVVLTEPLESDTITALSAACVAHVESAFITALQQNGVPGALPQAVN